MLTLLMVLGLVVLLSVVLRQLRAWLRARRVFREKGVVRAVEGNARTVRTWNFGYGEIYALWVELRFDTGESVCLFTRPGNLVLTGWVRVFLQIQPDRERSGTAATQYPIAVEVGADTLVVEKTPGIDPPREPLHVGVPAD